MAQQDPNGGGYYADFELGLDSTAIVQTKDAGLELTVVDDRMGLTASFTRAEAWPVALGLLEASQEIEEDR
jgi:hypothetical protein